MAHPSQRRRPPEISRQQHHGDGLKCYPGDSGGPWFNANKAYGIYKGQSSTGTGTAGCNWAVYMAINYISTINVSLMYG
ncbi:hypothetical protein [Nonomuraea sp. NPDC049504]|uniref:hypothetical protein n=1 Tax=Nonomuraea sp. NPDC049504 TaxID=3154729 RepID=UPI00342D3118